MVLNGLTSIYEIDSFVPLVELIATKVKKNDVRHERILADHIKAATFVLADEHPVEPSNTKQGYVLRRIIRRAVFSAQQLGIEDVGEIFISGQILITKTYGEYYPSLSTHEALARQRLEDEVKKFELVLQRGREFDVPQVVTGVFASSLATTYGLPVEFTRQMARDKGAELSPNFEEEFKQDQEKHQEKSRTATAGMFKGGLADHSPQSINYHTATHLLHQALRDVLGDHAIQRGSNITPERLRFDFAHPDKLTAEQLAEVERIVNDKIKADLPVRQEEMSVEEARQAGALGLFSDKYGERVKVYRIGDYSIEICGGPHVEHTGELGTFVITKQESAAAGTRRIKAVLHY